MQISRDNLTLDSVLSSMFGVSTASIIDYLMKTDNIDPACCVSLLRGRAKAKADAVKLAVEGFAMSNEQKIRVNVIQQHFTMIDRLIATLGERRKMMIPIVEKIMAEEDEELKFGIRMELIPRMEKWV